MSLSMVPVHSHFGWGVTPAELREILALPAHLHHDAFESKLARQSDIRHQSTSHIGRDGFQICMGVHDFKPSEISVKTVDNHIIIEGKHEERPDQHGHISRHFTRRYMLPEGYDPNTVVSRLSSDVLTVTAPKPAQIKAKCHERVIDIQQTESAHFHMKGNKVE